jgi:hypothetical protein
LVDGVVYAEGIVSDVTSNSDEARHIVDVVRPIFQKVRHEGDSLSVDLSNRKTGLAREELTFSRDS